MIRLNHEGCRWLDRGCGDIIVHCRNLVYDSTCDPRTSRCKINIRVKPDTRYRCSLSGVMVKGADHYLVAESVVFFTKFTEATAVKCSLANALPTPILSPAGLRSCPEASSKLQAFKNARLWQPLFPEMTLESNPYDSGGWLARFVRPSTCSFTNVAADDSTTCE